MKHPIQPIYTDKHGTYRFKPNKIVQYLLDNGGLDLNDIAVAPFENEEHEQFAQLIGYSLSGFGSLSYTSDETYNTAEKMQSDGMDEKDARIETLTHTLNTVRGSMKDVVTELFSIHPDDLMG